MTKNNVWAVRVVLSNGETRHLSPTAVVVEGALAVLEDFKAKREPFGGDWVETTDSSMIARGHIVEASVVPL